MWCDIDVLHGAAQPAADGPVLLFWWLGGERLRQISERMRLLCLDDVLGARLRRA